jgi:hypothetical protein
MTQITETTRHLTPDEQRVMHAALRAGVKILPDPRDAEITRLRTALERIAASAGPNMSRGTSGDGHARCIHLAREALCNG